MADSDSGGSQTLVKGIWKCGAGTRSRTRDLRITSQLLYQRSYTGKGEAIIAMEKPL